MKILFLLPISISLLGCSSISGFYEADPLFRQQSDLLNDEEYIVDLNKLQARVNSATTENLRNDLIEDLLTISDSSCARHQASVIAGLNTWYKATINLNG